MSSNYDPNKQDDQFARPADQGGYPQPQYQDVSQQTVNTTTVARRSGFNPLAVILPLLLIGVLGAGAYFLFFNKAALNNLASTTHSKLLPKDTTAFLTYQAKPGGAAEASLVKLREVFESQPGFKELWAKANTGTGDAGNMTEQAKECGVTDSFLTRVDNLKDLFGGNITLAVILDQAKVNQLIKDGQVEQPDQCASVKLINDSIVAIVNLDVQAAQTSGFLKTFQDQTTSEALGKATKDELYKEQQIYKLTQGENGYFATMIGREGVISGNKDMVKKVVDSSKDGNLSLDSDPQYAATAGKLPAERTITGYMSLGQIMRLAQSGYDAAMSGMDSSTMAMSGTSKEQLDCLFKQYSGINGNFMGSFTPRDNGVEIDMASSFTGLPAEMQNLMYVPKAMDSRPLFEQAPANSWLALGGQDIKGSVDAVLKSYDYIAQTCGGSGSNQLTSQQIKDQFKQATGLDLEADVLSWMDGEFTLYVQPGAMIPQGAFVLALSDAAKANASIEKITALLKQAGAPEITENGDLYTVPTGQGSFSPPITYGTKDNKFFIAVGAGVVDGFGQGDKLTGTDSYKQAFAGLFKQDSGRLYVNIAAIRKYAEGLMGDNTQEYNAQAKPLIAPFQGWGLTVQQSKDQQQIKQFFTIQKPQ